MKNQIILQGNQLINKNWGIDKLTDGQIKEIDGLEDINKWIHFKINKPPFNNIC